MIKRAAIRVYGRVQGVSFRYYAFEQVRRIDGLAGFVRNEPDGSVLVVAEGDQDRLERLISWCRQGSSTAKVDHLAVDWSPATGEFQGFWVE